MRALSSPALPPLPAELAQALARRAGAGEGGKRERTRAQLVDAAMQVFAARGVGAATLQDIATAAGVASGTVYNYFRSKEEVQDTVGAWLAEGLCQSIDESYAQVREAAERMAIGNRRYMWLAEQAPAWTLLLMEVGAAAPVPFENIRRYPLADLRLGVRQKAFRIVSEAAAMDMITGTVGQAMRTIAAGQAGPGHAAAVAATVLRGLGVAPEDAQAIVRRPLPPLAGAA